MTFVYNHFFCSIANPIAYVPQDDSLIGELTAREVTKFTATMKLHEPSLTLDAKVDNLLASLGLSRVADGIIGTLIFRGLSGGQKKRAEIANELIASPNILLLDEVSLPNILSPRSPPLPPKCSSSS